MGFGSWWHWTILLIAAALIVIAIWQAIKQPKQGSNSLVGFGGWLWLPVIGFVSTIALTLFGIIESLEGVRAFLNSDLEVLAPLKIPMIASLVSALLVVVSASICLYRIFVSKGNVRKFAVTHYVFLAFAGLVDLWAFRIMQAALPDLSEDPSIVRDAIRGIVIGAIWIPYFLFSKRVANTFEGALAIQNEGEHASR